MQFRSLAGVDEKNSYLPRRDASPSGVGLTLPPSPPPPPHYLFLTSCKFSLTVRRCCSIQMNVDTGSFYKYTFAESRSLSCPTRKKSHKTDKRLRALFNQWRRSKPKNNQSSYSDESQQTKRTQWTNQKSEQMHVQSVKRAKTRASKSRLVLCYLRTVSPFVTAHTFCASRDIRVS